MPCVTVIGATLSSTIKKTSSNNAKWIKWRKLNKPKANTNLTNFNELSYEFNDTSNITESQSVQDTSWDKKGCWKISKQ